MSAINFLSDSNNIAFISISIIWYYLIKVQMLSTLFCYQFLCHECQPHTYLHISSKTILLLSVTL